MKIWDCKIGEVDAALVPAGADAPMRRAVREAYARLTGCEPQFIFSGWGARLTEGERAVVESRRPEPQLVEFRVELESLINRCSLENGSDTPDYILAGFLIRCLEAFDEAANAREQWYGRKGREPGESLDGVAHRETEPLEAASNL